MAEISTLDKEQQKQAAILDAAMGVFAQYGYRKTSMEDLAKAAGMSRPALYQYFRNKEDIACSLTKLFYDRSAVAMRAALAVEGPLVEVLEQSFRVKLAGVEVIANSPHGDELMELGKSVSAEQIKTGAAQLERIFADWLDQKAGQGALALEGTAQDTARVIFSALEGLKKPPFDRLEQDIPATARLFARALQV
ncbi:TetR/AcrR family transcriptional regulator [Tropicibacter sp. R15_0]|uniref:TetR/AcrR family transcriptional regulator n=1 Tax=Tropicibacter sp. R15_0 TaxID=2821101 RepID=UPI001ADA2395|nr:TetR/AcrR family transcriptional regulator [Tropicibacter sp. R15_0]MBO9466746.1 TetR/AcrR family transcriptional regulator [Tropicibacter sp. R15_0]